MAQDGLMNLSVDQAWAELKAPVLALAEEMALRKAATVRPPVTLVARAGSLTAVRESGGESEVLLAIQGRPQIAVHELVAQLSGRLGPEVVLGFAADQSVGQRLVLPQQPPDVLKAIVRNKVESLAPWPLAQCLWGMRVSPIAGDAQHVAVDVGVVSRAVSDDVSAVLREAGTEVRALWVTLPDGFEAEIERDGSDVRLAARAEAARLAKTAASALIVLFVLGCWWIYSTASRASLLEEQTAAVMASLKPGGAPAGEPPQVTAANRLRQDRRDRLPAAAVMNELSKLLPDNVHLVMLTIDGVDVELKGQGSGVPALIEILEASPMFQDVNFAAATELDKDSNADAFALKATLEKAPPGDQP